MTRRSGIKLAWAVVAAWAWAWAGCAAPKVRPVSEARPPLRVMESSNGIVALQVAVRDLLPRRRTDPLVRLVGVTHLGSAEYYQRLQALLDREPLVLFEGVGARDKRFMSTREQGYSLQPALAKALGLRFQLAAIDYSHDRFVNSDLSEELAVCNHPGEVGFRTDLGSDSSRVIPNPPAAFKGVRIRSVRIDDWLAARGQRLLRKDLLKIDAEGADLDVLQGAERTLREDAPQVAVTTYHEDDHAHRIHAWLQSVQPTYRFRLKGFSFWTPRPRPVLLQASALEA